MRAWGHRSSLDQTYSDPFEHEPTRRRFISKVCSIAALQLAYSTCFTAIFVFDEDCKLWLKQHIWIGFLASLVCFIIMIMLCCCSFLARRFPINFILLIVFTICKSIVLSCLTTRFYPHQVFQALVGTVAICVGLTLFAIFAPCDFTGCGPYLCVLMVILMLLGLAVFFIRNRALFIVYIFVGLLVFSLYLVYDIQLMVGGHKNQYDEEDYIIAALGIYIDIVMIFYYLLQIIGIFDE